MKTNSVKLNLREGKQSIGCALSTTDLFLAERVAGLGFDFIVIDMEHCPVTISELQNLLIAMTPTPSTLVVRSPWNDRVWIKRILDVGAEGVVIPWVNSRKEAEEAVASCRYPPEGLRGCGPRRASQAAKSVQEYLQLANENILVLTQVETTDAMENLAEILNTDGLDGIMVGPADLACSLGYRDDLKNPHVEGKIKEILDTCLEKHAAFGIFCGSADMATTWLQRGATLATIGSDLGFLLQGAEEALSKARSGGTGSLG